MGDGTSQEHGTCLMDAKMKRIQNKCSVRTQDTLDNFGEEVRDDVITNSFAMQEFYELGAESTWGWINGCRTTYNN